MMGKMHSRSLPAKAAMKVIVSRESGLIAVIIDQKWSKGLHLDNVGLTFLFCLLTQFLSDYHLHNFLHLFVVIAFNGKTLLSTQQRLAAWKDDKLFPYLKWNDLLVISTRSDKTFNHRKMSVFLSGCFNQLIFK